MCVLCWSYDHYSYQCPMNKKSVDILMWEEYALSFVKRSSLDQLI